MSALPRPPLATLLEILGDWRSGEGRGAGASPRFVLATPGGRDDAADVPQPPEKFGGILWDL